MLTLKQLTLKQELCPFITLPECCMRRFSMQMGGASTVPWASFWRGYVEAMLCQPQQPGDSFNFFYNKRERCTSCVNILLCYENRWIPCIRDCIES